MSNTNTNTNIHTIGITNANTNSNRLLDFSATTDNYCNFLHGIDPIQTIDCCTDPLKKQNLITKLNDYKKKDVQFLYLIVLFFITTLIGTLFSIVDNTD
jgi:hypothetical protein